MTRAGRLWRILVAIVDQLRLLAVCPLLWLIVVLWPSRDFGFAEAMEGAERIARAGQDDGSFL